MKFPLHRSVFFRTGRKIQEVAATKSGKTRKKNSREAEDKEYFANLDYFCCRYARRRRRLGGGRPGKAPLFSTIIKFNCFKKNTVSE